MFISFLLGVASLISAGWVLNDAIKAKSINGICYFGAAMLSGCYFVVAAIGSTH